MGAWWDRNIIDPGKLPLLLALAAFILAFVVVRGITRLIRAGKGPFHNITPGGLHIHHAVPGVLLMVAGGFCAVGSGRHGVGAGIAAGLGLWLLLLALTPGRRRLLQMEKVHPDVRAVLHRKAAALALRDRAMEVPGVQSAKVRLKRRKAKVRAVAPFRDVDEVRTDLRSASEQAVEDLGLARPPKVSVKVVRPRRKG